MEDDIELYLASLKFSVEKAARERHQRVDVITNPNDVLIVLDSREITIPVTLDALNTFFSLPRQERMQALLNSMRKLFAQ